MPHLESIGTALPRYVVDQDYARAECERLHADRPALLRMMKVFDSGVKTRHFAFPPEYYLANHSFEQRNADYVEQGTALAEEAARRCLERAGVGPEAVDHLFFVTTTGLATPSVDALLAPRLGLRGRTRRWPLFGLGCAAGAGALIRANEVLLGSPKQRALVVALELCGQVFTPGAAGPTDLVGTALFGDGAAAVLVTGDGVDCEGPRIEASHTELFDGTRNVMGWDFTSEGMRLVLARNVTDVVTGRLRPVVDCFLKSAGLTFDDVDHWILHPGGRRIIEAYEETFGFSDGDLRWTRASLAEEGNLSSASVLFILRRVLEGAEPVTGDKGLVVALGPGFAAEMLVLGW
jgi:alkylresorcinol/alkylpyrone synthase